MFNNIIIRSAIIFGSIGFFIGLFLVKYVSNVRLLLQIFSTPCNFPFYSLGRLPLR